MTRLEVSILDDALKRYKPQTSPTKAVWYDRMQNAMDFLLVEKVMNDKSVLNLAYQ